MEGSPPQCTVRAKFSCVRARVSVCLPSAAKLADLTLCTCTKVLIKHSTSSSLRPLPTPTLPIMPCNWGRTHGGWEVDPSVKGVFVFSNPALFPLWSHDVPGRSLARLQLSLMASRLLGGEQTRKRRRCVYISWVYGSSQALWESDSHCHKMRLRPSPSMLTHKHSDIRIHAVYLEWSHSRPCDSDWVLRIFRCEYWDDGKFLRNNFSGNWKTGLWLLLKAEKHKTVGIVQLSLRSQSRCAAMSHN